MRCAWLLLLWFPIGCGRIGFDNLGDDTVEDGSVTGDADAATVFPPPCSIRAMVDDPLDISGTTIRFTTFRTSYVFVPTTAIDVVQGGQVIASTLSDEQGDYSLRVPTGGSAITPTIAITRPGVGTTYVTSNDAIDTGRTLLLETTSEATLNALYALGPYTRRADRGTLVVQSLNCTGVGEAGAAVAVAPAPEAIGYIAADGTLDGTSTQAPNVAAVAFNVVPGPVTITASAPGRMYYPFTVTVVAGDNQTVVSIMSVE